METDCKVTFGFQYTVESHKGRRLYFEVSKFWNYWEENIRMYTPKLFYRRQTLGLVMDYHKTTDQHKKH